MKTFKIAPLPLLLMLMGTGYEAHADSIQPVFMPMPVPSNINTIPAGANQAFMPGQVRLMAMPPRPMPMPRFGYPAWPMGARFVPLARPAVMPPPMPMPVAMNPVAVPPQMRQPIAMPRPMLPMPPMAWMMMRPPLPAMQPMPPIAQLPQPAYAVRPSGYRFPVMPAMVAMPAKPVPSVPQIAYRPLYPGVAQFRPPMPVMQPMPPIAWLPQPGYMARPVGYRQPVMPAMVAMPEKPVPSVPRIAYRPVYPGVAQFGPPMLRMMPVPRPAMMPGPVAVSGPSFWPATRMMPMPVAARTPMPPMAMMVSYPGNMRQAIPVPVMRVPVAAMPAPIMAMPMMAWMKPPVAEILRSEQAMDRPDFSAQLRGPAVSTIAPTELAPSQTAISAAGKTASLSRPEAGPSALPQPDVASAPGTKRVAFRKTKQVARSSRRGVMQVAENDPCAKRFKRIKSRVKVPHRVIHVSWYRRHHYKPCGEEANLKNLAIPVAVRNTLTNVQEKMLMSKLAEPTDI
jgi:hypothetical protein